MFFFDVCFCFCVDECACYLHFMVHMCLSCIMIICLLHNDECVVFPTIFIFIFLLFCILSPQKLVFRISCVIYRILVDLPESCCLYIFLAPFDFNFFSILAVSLLGTCHRLYLAVVFCLCCRLHTSCELRTTTFFKSGSLCHFSLFWSF